MMAPAFFIYRRQSYDFDVRLASQVGACRRSRLATVWFLMKEDLDRVELNEPALIQAWPGTLVYITVIRLKNKFTRVNTAVVFYAMENGDVGNTVASRTKLPRTVASWTTRRVFAYLVAGSSRVVFATDQARENYRTVVPDIETRLNSRLITALPMACPDCARRPKEPVITFLGSFEVRKGLLQLIEAWPIVQRYDPGIRLRILGKGDLEQQVIEWAKTANGVDVIVDPSRQLIHAELNVSKALILFSMPDRRWREQVGLPILEGLSHGCEIITSDQTGIAPWLGAHGHTVLPADAGAEAIASALVQAVRSPRSSLDVIESLPYEDTRIVADRWLFTEGAD
jgi:glycosyltransferase involved in cell wall biosynthesis